MAFQTFDMGTVQFKTGPVGPRPKLERPRLTPKELLILVFYIPLGNLSEQRARTRLAEVREAYKNTAKEMEKDTNYKVHLLVVPTKSGEAKVECIFPKEKDEVVSEFMQEMKEQKLLP